MATILFSYCQKRWMELLKNPNLCHPLAMAGNCFIGDKRSRFEFSCEEFDACCAGLESLMLQMEVHRSDGIVECKGETELVVPLFDKINNRANQRGRTARRRARLAAVGGNHSREDLERIWDLQRECCPYSGASLGSTFAAGNFHVDHIIPVVIGGTNWASNLALVTARINQLKKGFDRRVILAHLYSKAERKVVYQRIHRIDRERRKIFPQPDFYEGELDGDLFGLCHSFGWKTPAPRRD